MFMLFVTMKVSQEVMPLLNFKTKMTLLMPTKMPITKGLMDGRSLSIIKEVTIIFI